MTRVLVTGADGFIGRVLVPCLRRSGHVVVPTVRSAGGADSVATGDIAECKRWPDLLAGVEVVLHLAARAHVMRERLAEPVVEYRRINLDACVRLATEAARAGVRRFVFLSSIGVNGNDSGDAAFTETDQPNPSGPYAASKWEAERALLRVGAQTGLQITRVRPPLVVGPAVKGNLQRLLQLVDSGVPLPLAAVRNRRSLIDVEDLCELLVASVTHEAAANELFLAADVREMSTPELLRAIAAGLRRPARLFPVPVAALEWGARICRVEHTLGRLTGSLRVSAEKVSRSLAWSPRIGIEAGIERMARAYRLQERYHRP